MGIGFALGGIAKGIQDQQELGLKKNALDLQTQELKSNDAYRNAALGLEKKRLDATTGIEAASKAREVYDQLYNSAKDIITTSQKAGKPVQAIAQAIQPLLTEMQSLAPTAGIDTSATAAQLGGLLNSGTQATPTTPTDHMGQIFSDFRAGKPLSKQDKALLDNYFKTQNPMTAPVTQGLGDMATPAPSSLVPDLPEPNAPAPAGGPAPAAAAPAPAPAPAAAPAPARAAPPPVPQALVGKQPHWSPSDPGFFFLPDGTITDLQGRPVGKINAAAQ